MANLFGWVLIISTVPWAIAVAGIGDDQRKPGLTPVEFARDIRPIFAEHCYRCHGPKLQKSDFRLDGRMEAFQGGATGQPVIAPGDPGRSLLIDRISSVDLDQRMPPEGEPVSPDQITLIRQWIQQGAPWPDESPSDEIHWSLVPPRWPALPSNRNRHWLQNPIDSFVLARLERHGLDPADDADRVALLRRVTLDLTGLPPSPDEIEKFITGALPDAYEKVVDRLLSSPRYGERWGRHWLDVVRFAESAGFEMNSVRPTAWHYRDWVIQSYNEDQPYDRFIINQLAGDALGTPVATGFLVAGPLDLVSFDSFVKATQRETRQNELNAFITVTGESFLGLTVGCARCHNHKFDPVSQTDYYALEAVFAGAGHPARHGVDGNKHIYRAHFKQPEKPTHRLYRGDPAMKREVVKPASIRSVGRSFELSSDAPEQQRRLTLARWIAHPDNPLTARVMANRLWHHHFGRGLVETPNDFGIQGAPPSHPQLLDWLAKQLTAGDWSLKLLHRRIVFSRTYRQSNRTNEKGIRGDPDARLLSRFPRRRLEAEAIRDSILFVAGNLDFRMGGPGYSAFHPTENPQRGNIPLFNPKLDFGSAEWRRMVYEHRIRMEQDAIFGAFDCPDGGQFCPKRTQSTTPIQALNLFNSRFIAQQAKSFAERVVTAVGDHPLQQIQCAYRLVYGRDAAADEVAACVPVLKEHGLPTVCRVLFNTNEFLFVP